MQKRLFSVIILALVIVGCGNNYDREAMDAIAHSLARTNELIANKNNRTYSALEKKLKDRMTRAKASLWTSKALMIRELTADLNAYLDSLKTQLQLPGTDNRDVSDCFSKESNKIYERLLAYCEAIPVVIDSNEFTESSPLLKRQLYKDIVSWKKQLVSRLGMEGDSTIGYPVKPQQWIARHLDITTPAMASMVLNKWQSDILTAENIMIEHCYNQLPIGLCGYYRFSFFGMISSRYVKSGQLVEIRAGKGYYSMDVDPNIMIFDSCVAVNEAAVYTFTARGKPGKYYVPVTFDYREPNGRPLTVTRNLEYIIAP